MATYPSSIYSPVTPNVTDPLNINDHFTIVNDEIVALQNELAINPKGEFSDVAARLLAIGQTSNLMLNGNQDIDEANDGTLVGVTDAAYMTDNHRWNQVGAGVIDYAQSTNVPSNGLSANSLEITVATNDATIAATDHYDFTTFIEGLDYYQVHNGVQIRFTFWVWSDVTGTYGLRLMNNAGNRSYTTTFNVSVASTWQPVPITFLTDTSGTWEFDENIGLQATITLAAGTDFHTGVTETWQAGSAQTTSAQVNFMATASNVFRFTQSKMGRFTSPLLNRPIASERLIAKRYFRQLGVGLNGSFINANEVRLYDNFHDPMRVAPNAILLRDNPSITEIATAIRVGVSSIISGQVTLVDGFRLDINGFSGATALNAAHANNTLLLAFDARF